MSRPPVFPAEDKIRIVLCVLSGGLGSWRAARRGRPSAGPVRVSSN